MKNYKGYQQYGLTAAAFFNRMKAAFRNDFHYPFERECPNYYFAKIYDEDPRYILVIDLGNLSAAVIVNEFQFSPKSSHPRNYLSVPRVHWKITGLPSYFRLRSSQSDQNRSADDMQ